MKTKTKKYLEYLLVVTLLLVFLAISYGAYRMAISKPEITAVVGAVTINEQGRGGVSLLLLEDGNVIWVDHVK